MFEFIQQRFNFIVKEHVRYFAVIGNPIRHSKSPLIHEEFGKQLKMNVHYVAIEVPVEDFINTIEDFRSIGGIGMNVTVPYKVKAWEYADEHTERASHACAVNTLKLDGDLVFGDNTDGIGMVRDLRDNQGVKLEGAKVLMIGAGGAARGVLGPLLQAGVDHLTIANRTEARAHDLARTFDDVGPVEGRGFHQLDGNRYDLVINATSASLGGKVPAIPATVFGEGSVAYDIMYGNEPTVFMKWAQEKGADRVSDGTGMLVEQAAESFHVWNDVRPDTKPVIEKLRSL